MIKVVFLSAALVCRDLFRFWTEQQQRSIRSFNLLRKYLPPCFLWQEKQTLVSYLYPKYGALPKDLNKKPRNRPLKVHKRLDSRYLLCQNKSVQKIKAGWVNWIAQYVKPYQNKSIIFVVAVASSSCVHPNLWPLTFCSCPTYIVVIFQQKCVSYLEFKELSGWFCWLKP